MVMLLTAVLVTGCLGAPRPDGSVGKSVKKSEILEVDVSSTTKAADVSVQSPGSAAAQTALQTLDENLSLIEEEDAADFSIIQNTVWHLNEVKLTYGLIHLDRAALKTAVYGDFFSIQFMKEGTSGTAAPNNYFAPYSLLDGNNIGLRQIVTTQKALMGDVSVINGLTEADYYRYLQKIYRWSKEKGGLFLYSKTEAGDEVALCYLPEVK